MVESIKDRLMNLKHDREIGFINFFNDGSITSDDYRTAKALSKHDPVSAIEETFYNAARSYSYDSDFNEINMGLLVGLVYAKELVNEDNTLVEGALPIYDLVRYYTGHANCYQDGMQTNKSDYYYFGTGRQGYIYYSDLVRKLRKDGLEFHGPETFEEFCELMEKKEPFDISISADLKEDEEFKLEM